jgi:hypothetical protein
MPLMHTGELKNARKYKHLSQFGGIGFEWWQFVLGAVATAIVAGADVLVSFVLPGLLLFGIAAAVAAGVVAMIAPNLIDTHHKDPKDHLIDEAKKRRQHRLIVNDRRVPFPRPIHLECIVEVTDHPDIEETLKHD